MGTFCMIGLHSWSFCKCTKCGQTRDEAHNWDGCKCRTCNKVLRDYVNELLKGNAAGLFGGSKAQSLPSRTQAPRETVWRKGNALGLPAGTRWVTVGGRTTEFWPSPEADSARHKANIEKKAKNEAQNEFIRAAAWGDTPWGTDRLKALIAAGADVNAKGKAGKTALLVAAENGQVDNVNLLIAAGADVNATDNRGSTSLIFAARLGSLDCVKALIAAGADVKNNNGYTALTLAADNGHAGCVKALMAAAGARF